MTILKVFLIVERIKKRTVRERMRRIARAPKNTLERASELGEIIRNRLGLDPKKIALSSDWHADLRIPAGELSDFFEDIAEAFLMEDALVLESRATYGELLDALDISPQEMLR